jgi:hypothetical protein
VQRGFTRDLVFREDKSHHLLHANRLANDMIHVTGAPGKTAGGVQLVLAPVPARGVSQSAGGDDDGGFRTVEGDIHPMVSHVVDQVLAHSPWCVDQPAPAGVVGGHIRIPVAQVGLPSSVAKRGRLSRKIQLKGQRQCDGLAGRKSGRQGYLEQGPLQRITRDRLTVRPGQPGQSEDAGLPVRLDDENQFGQGERRRTNISGCLGRGQVVPGVIEAS